MSYKACFLGILLLLAVPGAVFAQTTINFSASLTGTQTCGDFDTVKLKQTVFVKFNPSSFSFNVFLDSGFSNLYVTLLPLQHYQIGQTATTDTYTIGAASSSPHAALFEGTVKISNTSVTAVGAFVDYDENVTDCMNYGTLKSLKIIF